MNAFTDLCHVSAGSSPASSSTPAQSETSPAPETVAALKEDASSAPRTVAEEITTSAPKIPATADGAFPSTTASPPSTSTTKESRASEIPATPEAASEDTSESNLSPALYVEGVTTSAAKILSTVAEAAVSPTAEPGGTTASVDLSAAPADITNTAASTAPADTTASSAENTTPGAAATAESTAAENPGTSSPAPSVPPTPETTTAIATTDLIPLPNYMKLVLLTYLKDLCQPRRPGMPRATVEGCIRDPTCGNQQSSAQRLVQFRYRAPANQRVCLRCKVSGCNTQPPRPPRPFPDNRFPFPPPRPFPGNRLPPSRGFPGSRRRAKRSTSNDVVIIIIPQ
ncbi:uncharacterized protein [Aphelocoma coerulescens]|uniref:uncharacterized protein isoform X3 n=1 Tax=Aphelocoma coerulescens TaxID=39617 RepID=UPI003604C2DC